MSLVLTDSFATYGTINDVVSVGPWEANNIAQLALLPTGGPEGQPCIQFSPDEDNDINVVTTASYGELYLPWEHGVRPYIVGFMFKLDQFADFYYDTGYQNILIANGRFNRVYWNISLGFYNTGQMAIRIQADSKYHDSDFYITPGTWYHMSLRFEVENVANIKLLVNGVIALDLTGVDGYYSFSTGEHSLLFGCNEDVNYNCTGMIYNISDFYIQDELGGVVDDHLGRDTRVSYLPADSSGASSDFTPTSGTNNAAMVDENPGHDFDTTRNRSSSVGAKDLMTVSTVTPSTSGEIYAVNVKMVANKGSVDDRTMNIVQYHNGSEEDSAAITLTQDYADHNAIFHTNPDTLDQWTKTDFATAQFGYKIAT